MLAIALTLAAMATAAALLLRRRRARRASGISPALDPLPAGLKHLAAEVSELSDCELHLAAGRASSRKRRLGALLALR